MLQATLSASSAGLLVFCLSVLAIAPFAVVESVLYRRRQRERRRSV